MVVRVKWRDFELPTRVICEEKTLSSTFGRFIIEPFEQGFGHTIGNGLRRILLSSIEGAAVTAVRIKDVPHEFGTIENVLEDVTDIILNFKRLTLRLNSDEPKRLFIEVKRKGPVTAADIKPEPTVEIINPDLHLATLVEEREFVAEILVRKGRGYVSAQENASAAGEPEIGLIHVDSIFSPVIHVSYRIENTRVGKLTNYDRLLIDIRTNGAITPEMALVEASKIYRKHINPLVQYFEIGRELLYDERKKEEARKREGYLAELKRKLALPLSELDLSVRATNCLATLKIKTIEELVKRTEQDLLNLKNFGKTTLKEVKNKLAMHGLSLGMDPEAILSKKE